MFGALYQSTIQQSLLRRSAFIGLAIALTIQALIFYYLERLRKERCECALTGDYRALRALVLFLMSYNAAIFILLLLVQSGWMPIPLATTAAMLSILAPIISIINLIFMILSLKYIINLYKISCQCADNGLRLLYLIYVVFFLGMLAISVLMLFFTIIFVVSMSAGYKKNAK